MTEEQDSGNGSDHIRITVHATPYIEGWWWVGQWNRGETDPQEQEETT